MTVSSEQGPYTLYQAYLATHPRRILLAEDDGDVRALLARVLRRDGYEVIEAKDGVELLDQIGTALLREKARPAVDVVITDVMMPGCTGLEVLAGLRRADWEIPFILITAFANAATRERAKKLGAAAVFSKPLDLDDLRTAVLNATRLAASPAHERS